MVDGNFFTLLKFSSSGLIFNFGAWVLIPGLDLIVYCLELPQLLQIAQLDLLVQVCMLTRSRFNSAFLSLYSCLLLDMASFLIPGLNIFVFVCNFSYHSSDGLCGSCHILGVSPSMITAFNPSCRSYRLSATLLIKGTVSVSRILVTTLNGLSTSTRSYKIVHCSLFRAWLDILSRSLDRTMSSASCVGAQF